MHRDQNAAVEQVQLCGEAIDLHDAPGERIRDRVLVGFDADHPVA